MLIRLEKEYIERQSLMKVSPFSKCGGDTSEYTEGYLDCVEDARKAINSAPTAEVVAKEQYEHLLKLAKKMHTWIFLNTGDEQAAYDEMGLTDEDNALLGYGGKIEFAVGGKDEA